MKRPTVLVLVFAVLLLAGCAQMRATGVHAQSSEPRTSSASVASLALTTGEWKAVACGSYQTLAIKQNGTLWAWGLNDYGQLGQGRVDVTVIAHPVPLRVGRARDWVAVSCGDGDAFALQKDGTLWAWGNNSNWGGNLGLGTVTQKGVTFVIDRWSPTRVGHARDWEAVFAGYEHGFAIKKNGALWGWGPNLLGALGLGNTESALVPAEVGRETTWASAAGGGDFSLALKKNGTIWASGSNIYGNLGLGDTTDTQSFTRVGGAADWAAVSAGIGYSMALDEDGTLWAWGDNSFGELGLGDTAERNLPTQVGGAHDWAAIACLGHHSVALKTDGTLWAWGENSYGQLGLGDTTNRLSPTRVGTSRDWVTIAPGCADSYDTAALQRNGTLWAWGFNRFGQLGLGDTTNRLVPTEVLASR